MKNEATLIPHTFSLDGDWEFAYEPEVALEKVPVVPEAASFQARMPVPGYWDDHIDRLRCTAFWPKTRFNPHHRGREVLPLLGLPADATTPYLLGLGFYRKCLDVPAELAGRCITLHVGGAVMDTWVWVNGQYVGYHLGYTTPFEMALEGQIRAGESNEIILGVANTRRNIYGTSMRGHQERNGGIYRPVSIHVAGEARIGSLYLRPADGNSRIVWCLEVEPAAGAAGLPPLDADWQIRDRGTGTVLGHGTAACREPVAEWSTETFGLRPWSDRNPALYDVEVRITKGRKLQDRRVQPFGSRSLETEGYGLRLNGVPVFLRGVCEHHYFPLTCTAPRDVETYRSNLRKLKALGFNWLRFHTWIPSEEYMQAADELGLMIQVEPPYGAVTDEEWLDIFRTCRKHPSVVIYCGGNEELVDDEKIEFLAKKAALMRKHVPDGLFNPMEALRGVEYGWEWGGHDIKQQMGEDVVWEPYLHNPRRLERLKEFCDVFGQYSWGWMSYISVWMDFDQLDRRLEAYGRPCLTHEMCISPNYINLDLEHRYEGTRIGPGLFTAVREHLAEKGLLHKAALYYRNACAHTRILHKHAAESARKVRQFAGYDFLGGTDHHWIYGGYPCGIMNEFYEMKPGETEADVLRYNGESVLLLYHTNHRNFTAGDRFSMEIGVSLFGPGPLKEGELAWSVRGRNRDVILRGRIPCRDVANGRITRLGAIEFEMPGAEVPERLVLHVRLTGGVYDLDNEWNFWVFPKWAPPETTAGADKAVRDAWADHCPAFRPPAEQADARLRVVSSLDAECVAFLAKGGDVLLLGYAPFPALELTFRSESTGRADGHRGLVLADHPLLDGFPHDGFGDWQFYTMLDGGHSVVFEDGALPFEPIVELIPAYKRIRRQAGVFEMRVGEGRLLVCSLRMEPSDPAAAWLVGRMVRYASSSACRPRTAAPPAALRGYVAEAGQVEKPVEKNMALDPNAERRAGRGA